MNRFLRNALISCSTRNSLFPAVALAAAAAAGSVLYHASMNSDSGTRISFSLPAPLLESLSLPWEITQGYAPRPSFISTDNWGFGIRSWGFSRVSPASSTDVNNESSGVIGEASQPSRGCLGRDSMANAAAKVGPAVVSLSVTLGFLGTTIGKTFGSGTIIDSDGTVLTCAHVVAGFKFLSASSKGKVDVTLQDGRTYEGTVLHADLHSNIAIVKIKSKLPLPTAKLGSSSKLRLGDWVLAIGCPLSLQNTVTAGIVSYVDRKSSDLHLGGMHGEYLQTDCAVHLGSCGGPLVNIDGELVGVYIRKGTSPDAVRVAVPIESVAKIIEHFKRSDNRYYGR